VIGIDTNILIRYLVKDDPVQTPAAVRIIHSLSFRQPGWLAITVLVELAWTLRRIYKLDRIAIAAIVEKLLGSKDMILEQREIVYQALLLYGSSRADFADCLIAVGARNAGCAGVATFDQIAARDLGMELIA
jgi:predicted nucleic-acid-binding protein